MSSTKKAFDSVIDKSKRIFANKLNDYGTAWRVLRPRSLTDQILIKARRIRTLQEKEEQRVGEGIEPEFYGILNYAIMALIQLKHAPALDPDLSTERAQELYERTAQEAQDLMEQKNHDYGEAWRDMRIESITDMILMKLFRVRKIEENQGETKASEGVEANFQDIINYSIFALIKLSERHHGTSSRS